MKNDIKTLYKYLLDSKKHQYKGWYLDYKRITANLALVKEQLENGSNLTDETPYVNTPYKNKHDFLKKLFANTGNGVSSNGQSIFSDNNFQKVKDDHEFFEALQSLIIEASEENHNAFAQIWSEKLGQNNPVQTNRATAACNTNLSTTCDGGKFDNVFDWLYKNNYTGKYDGANTWYAKNIFLVDYIRNELKDVETDPHWINIFVWCIYENLASPFNLKKQLVKYGAPGTGKTYLAKEVAKLQFDIWKNTYGGQSDLTFESTSDFVQFHPSYSYEDFIEGLRPYPDSNGQSQLKLQNGIFKELCIRAAKWEIDLCKWKIDKKFHEVEVQDIESFTSEKPHWNIIKNADYKTLVSEIVPPFFIIIDEINRAELSRVFGELMYCLEYRGTEGVIKTQYAELNTQDTGMIKIGNSYKFFIPNNIYILGSMNTIDRSVDSFDFALRRRFAWEEVNPDIDLLKYHLSEKYPKWIDLAENLRNLNKSIEAKPLLGKDFCIGHAYLWNLPYLKESSVSEVRKAIWKNSIKSILQEYLRGTGKENLIDEFAKEFGIKQ